MAEIVIDATVQVLLEKLIAVASEEIGLVLDFKNELKTLEDSLRMIQGFVDDASKRCIQDNQAVKQWLQNLEDVAYEADNLLDEVNYEIVRRKFQIQTQMNRKACCSSSLSLLNSTAFRSKIGHKIKDVNAKLKIINERASSYGLQQSVAVSAVSLPLVMETNSIAIDPIFIGRDRVASSIIDDMIKSSDGLVVSVVPIVGMGGLGKTTLARNIFNHQSIEKRFNARIWVSVSKYIDNKDLLMKILESLSKEFVQASLGVETILAHLRSKLKGARYLLVIDDYLNDSTHEWEDFFYCMMGISPNRGNFIIVTTRNQIVASNVRTLRHSTVHSLDGLSDDDCWSIIKARTFPSQPVPVDFEAIGKEIACRCRGLPLAANVVGGSLRDKGIDDWKSFRHESVFSMSDPDDDFVSQVLKISFDRLQSSVLKKCFAYCSNFRKGEKLERERLIQLWMAEGLLFGNSDGSDDQMEILGDKFYNILLQNFFLQEPIMDKYGRIEYSKMHDFVRYLSHRVEKAKPHNAKDVIRRVIDSLVIDHKHDIKEEQTICLRTSFLKKFKGAKFVDNMFPACKYLRVLDLRRTVVYELTSSIDKLIHLRFLDLSHTEIRNLPDSICKLFNLQTLRLIRCEYLRELPDQLKFLVGLRHFAFSRSRNQLPPLMPPEISNLTSLRTLSSFIVSDKKGCRIDELGYLKYLQGKLRIWNLEKVSDKEESKRACLSEKQNIENLKVVWSDSDTREGNNNDNEVLEGLQPHPNLKGLTITNFGGDRFPSWTITLHKLIKIVLKNCEKCQEIPTLGHLPHLKILLVKGLSNVRSIGPSFYIPHQYCEDESSRYDVPFPALERLTLEAMDNLGEWVEAPNTGATAFPRLEYLKIQNCRYMMTAPSHDFPSLKILYIDDVRSKVPLAMISKKVSSLTKVCIDNSDLNSKLLETLLRNNQRLQELRILRCDNLTHIRLSDTFEYLRELQIWGCSNLASIQNLKGLSALRHLEIYRCEGLTELQGEMLESSKSLEVLAISGCQNLRSIPHGMYRHKTLRYLSIGPFSERTGFTLLNETLKCVHRLRELSLCGYLSWESLPNQLQHLTSLICLDLCYFGMEALPEWFSNMSSLERLNMYDCKNLSDVKCLRYLTRLKRLNIVGCIVFEHQLNESSRADRSQWPEISHIPNVYVNSNNLFDNEICSATWMQKMERYVCGPRRRSELDDGADR